VNLLLRAEAAAQAGLDEYGWASLDRVLSKLTSPGPRNKMYASQALSTSRKLESAPGAQGVIRGLRRAAAPARPADVP